MTSSLAWRCLFGCLAFVAVTELGCADNARPFTFRRGVNISHWLSQNTDELTYGAGWFSERDVQWIAAHGFDHIRLPVDGRLVVRADGSLDESKLAPVDQSIRWARSSGLGLILDMHFLPGADFNNGGEGRVFEDAALQEKVADFWARLARRYAGEGPWLRFEILNEPVAPQNAQLNVFNRRMLAAIRASNPTRIVYLSSNRWSIVQTIDDVEVPADPNLAITVHFYEPMVFTHQQASWAGFNDKMPPVHFPGKLPDVSAGVNGPTSGDLTPGRELTVAEIEKAFAHVAEWAAVHAPGREIYLGEFGVYVSADAQSKRNWIAAVRGIVERRGWSWAIWDYNDSFGVRLPHDGGTTPIYDGLFPSGGGSSK
jgi:endoglucanase